MDKIKLYQTQWTEITKEKLLWISGGYKFNQKYLWNKFDGGQSIYFSQYLGADRGSIAVGYSDYSEAGPEDITPGGGITFGDKELDKFFEFVKEDDPEPWAPGCDDMDKIKLETEEI